MQVRDALELLRNDGYCLWVGGGLTQHLSGNQTQGWADLTAALEAAAQLGPPDLQESLPERLERVHDALGLPKFQARLRQRTLHKLANAVLVESWKLGHNGQEPIPHEARQLGKLGLLANPIVNFNIETLTSLALACPGGPCSIKTFTHPSPAKRDSFNEPRLIFAPEGATRFPRHVYHPHGAIELSGICVMTDGQYRSHEGSLAFQLAVHSAFMSNLAIVGMSLDDDYLRCQLAAFRKQIREVFWFTDRCKAELNELRTWAFRHAITVVEVDSWPSFWSAVDSCMPAPTEAAQSVAWEFACLKARESLTGRITEIDNRMERYPADNSRASMREQRAQLAAEGGESVVEPEGETLTSEQRAELRRFLADWRQNAQRSDESRIAIQRASDYQS